MPIQHAIWKVGQPPTALATSALESEQLLEEMIVADPSILSNEWMLIGQQEITSYGGRLDLLAIAPDASLVLIELKRSKTPRDIVAQAIDYASWVEQLSAEKIAQIYHRFSDGGNLDDAFRDRFNIELDEDNLNQSHQIIIVASELDASTERIVNYLDSRDIPVNVVTFQVFQNGKEQYLSRAWLIDLIETQSNISNTGRSRGPKEPWNGEYYVSFGDMSSRSWEDARKYGYISAGGDSWYSRTLKLLSPGDRVWVNIPKTGYVGVGHVLESVVPAIEFKVESSSGPTDALEILEHASLYKQNVGDPAKTEYFVRVQWIDTVTKENAISEVGLFGNQNTVCRPSDPKWRHTVDRLKLHFNEWDS